MEMVTGWELKGHAEGQRALLLLQIAHKFGPVPPQMEARITALDPTQIEALAKALLDCTQPPDLNAWLDQHEPAPDS